MGTTCISKLLISKSEELLHTDCGVVTKATPELKLFLGQITCCCVPSSCNITSASALAVTSLLLASASSHSLSLMGGTRWGSPGPPRRGGSKLQRHYPHPQNQHFIILRRTFVFNNRRTYNSSQGKISIFQITKQFIVWNNWTYLKIDCVIGYLIESANTWTQKTIE